MLGYLSFACLGDFSSMWPYYYYLRPFQEYVFGGINVFNYLRCLPRIGLNQPIR